jgi:hypothetical protein
MEKENLYFELVQDGHPFVISIQTVVNCLKFAISELWYPDATEYLDKVLSKFEITEKENREALPTGKVIEDDQPTHPTLLFELENDECMFMVDIETFSDCLWQAMHERKIPFVIITEYGKR